MAEVAGFQPGCKQRISRHVHVNAAAGQALTKHHHGVLSYPPADSDSPGCRKTVLYHGRGNYPRRRPGLCMKTPVCRHRGLSAALVGESVVSLRRYVPFSAEKKNSRHQHVSSQSRINTSHGHLPSTKTTSGSALAKEFCVSPAHVKNLVYS